MTGTTIGEAARDRFAEWAPAARTQDGSRTLPGSPRLTDHDIWSATHRKVATDKSRCGSALAETARPGREDVSIDQSLPVHATHLLVWPQGQKKKFPNPLGAPIRSVEGDPLVVDPFESPHLDSCAQGGWRAPVDRNRADDFQAVQPGPVEPRAQKQITKERRQARRRRERKRKPRVSSPGSFNK